MIAFLCATSREMICLTSLMKETVERPSPSGSLLLEGDFGNQRFLVFASGVGKVPAAAGSRFIIDSYPLDAIINYGIAGALSPAMKTGDLVIATGLIHGDTGVAHSQGFKTTGPGSCEKNGLLFEPHCVIPHYLIKPAKAAADETNLVYHLGKILTCDQVVLDPELRAHLGDRFDALAVEMEGAAVAYVAMGEGIPFIAIRAISDELSHDFVGLEKTLPIKGESRRHLWGKRFLFTVTNQAALSRARELSRGINLALENMASFHKVFLTGLPDSLCGTPKARA
jgi:adenosylhomocysteine nucleosidase